MLYDHRMHVRRAHCALCLIAVMALPLAVRAQTAEPELAANPLKDEGYKLIVAAAVAEYDHGNWAEARALFLQAHARRPSARTLRTLGMTAFELRDYPSAVRELRGALDHQERPLDDALRAEVQSLLERATAFVGRFRVATLPPSATLLVDDRSPQLEQDGSLLLGLGEHVLRVSAPGHAQLQRKLQVAGYEDAVLELALVPVTPPSAPVAVAPVVLPPRDPGPAAETERGGYTWTWVAAAGTIVFGGTALGLWLAGDAEVEDRADACKARREAALPCDGPEDLSISTLETLDGLTTAALIASGASAALTVTLYFVERPESEAQLGLSIGPTTRLWARF